MVQEDLKKLIKMAELMEKYFLVYFLPRGNWENISESNENEVFKILKKYIFDGVGKIGNIMVSCINEFRRVLFRSSSSKRN